MAHSGARDDTTPGDRRTRGVVHHRIAGVTLACLVIVGIGLPGASSVDAAQPQQAAQDGFVPMGDIPPEDQLPAAPLLMVAYAAVWALAVGYLWTIRRRLGSVEKELADVSRRVADRDGT